MTSSLESKTSTEGCLSFKLCVNVQVLVAPVTVNLAVLPSELSDSAATPDKNTVASPPVVPLILIPVDSSNLILVNVPSIEVSAASDPDNANGTFVKPSPLPVNSVAVRDPVTEVSTLICKPSASIEAVDAPLDIWSKLSPVTPDAGILYNPLPSPMYEPVKSEPDIEPTISKLPVFCVFVIITSSTEGPCEPDLDKNIFPSVVFIDNSPSSNCELFGILPDIALLRSFTVCPIYMDLYSNFQWYVPQLLWIYIDLNYKYSVISIYKKNPSISQGIS